MVLWLKDIDIMSFKRYGQGCENTMVVVVTIL